MTKYVSVSLSHLTANIFLAVSADRDEALPWAPGAAVARSDDPHGAQVRAAGEGYVRRPLILRFFPSTGTPVEQCIYLLTLFAFSCTGAPGAHLYILSTPTAFFRTPLSADCHWQSQGGARCGMDGCILFEGARSSSVAVTVVGTAASVLQRLSALISLRVL